MLYVLRESKCFINASSATPQGLNYVLKYNPLQLLNRILAHQTLSSCLVDIVIFHCAPESLGIGNIAVAVTSGGALSGEVRDIATEYRSPPPASSSRTWCMVASMLPAQLWSPPGTLVSRGGHLSLAVHYPIRKPGWEASVLTLWSSS